MRKEFCISDLQRSISFVEITHRCLIHPGLINPVEDCHSSYVSTDRAFDRHSHPEIPVLHGLPMRPTANSQERTSPNHGGADKLIEERNAPWIKRFTLGIPAISGFTESDDIAPDHIET